MKIELSSLRREMLLFLTTNMAAVTSRENQQFSCYYWPARGGKGGKRNSGQELVLGYAMRTCVSDEKM